MKQKDLVFAVLKIFCCGLIGYYGNWQGALAFCAYLWLRNAQEEDD